MKITITFPDGSKKEFPRNVTPYEIAKSISKGLAKEVITAKVNGKLVDLCYPIRKDAIIKLFKFDSKEGRHVYWHSSAHIMAQAVKELYPHVKIAIGPSIENGFYYDFDKEIPFTEADLKKIEDKMVELSHQDMPFQRKEISREDARQLFEEMDADYKLELLEDIPEIEKVSIYENGNFTDL